MHCLHPNTVLYLNNYKRKEVITIPRTKGSKNRPKTNITKGYATQIAEKAKADAKVAEEVKKAETESVVKRLLASGMSADEILEKLK